MDSDRAAWEPSGEALELVPVTRDSNNGPRGRRSGLLGLGEALAGVAARPLVAGVELGRRTERELRAAVANGVDAATLATVDAVLASPLAGEVVDRVLASPLARATVERALSGPLVEAASRDVVQHAVLERVAGELLPAEYVDGMLERALDSAAMEKVVVRVIESELFEEAVERLLKTDELWLLVDEIARSPAVAEAIQRQSLGFADEVAGGMRSRSRRIDDRLETGARRVFRRKPRVPPAPEGGAG